MAIQSVLFFSFLYLIAQIISPKYYHWRKNTIDELTAQNYNEQWIMQLGYMGFGFLLMFTIIIHYFYTPKPIQFMDILLVLYGLNMMFVGIYRSKPIVQYEDYNKKEASLHNYFSYSTVIIFSLIILRTEGTCIWINYSNVKYYFLATHIILFLSSFWTKKHRGILDRLLYSLHFIWLLML